MRTLLLMVLVAASVEAQSATMDRSLSEVTVAQLHHLYETHRYTVTQVVQWYVARIARYDGIYQAIETPEIKDALAVAAREDTEARNKSFQKPPLWGIPIVV